MTWHRIFVRPVRPHQLFTLIPRYPAISSKLSILYHPTRSTVPVQPSMVPLNSKYGSDVHLIPSQLLSKSYSIRKRVDWFSIGYTTIPPDPLPPVLQWQFHRPLGPFKQLLTEEIVWMSRLLIQRVDINFPGRVGWEELFFRSIRDIGREDTCVAYLWLTQAQARTLPPMPVFLYRRTEYWEPSSRPLNKHQVFYGVVETFHERFRGG